MTKVSNSGPGFTFSLYFHIVYKYQENNDDDDEGKVNRRQKLPWAALNNPNRLRLLNSTAKYTATGRLGILTESKRWETIVPWQTFSKVYRMNMRNKL